MSVAKIQLSKQELELVSNVDLILTKNEIMRKMTLLLQELQDEQQKILAAAPGINQEVLKSSYKISRGENYKGLPWLVLDHPRLFTQQNIFAIRTLFWWGKYFVTTLHLAGIYKDQLEENIFSSLKELDEEGFYICINEDPWQHQFEPDNYLPIHELSLNEIEKVRGKSFLKIAKKLPLQHIDMALENLEKDYAILVKLAGDQLLPRR